MTTEWFPGWVVRHIQRHDNAGLPDLDKRKIFYETWRDEFAQRGIDLAAAEAASRKLAAQKYTKHLHFKALLDLAMEAKYTGYASSVEQAKDAAKNCPDCYGQGLASVRCRNTGMNFAAYCVCDFGTRLLNKATQSAKANEVLIDLAKIRVGETYRALIHGEAVTLDFTEDESEDFTHYLPVDLREKADRLREEEASCPTSTTSRTLKSPI